MSGDSPNAFTNENVFDFKEGRSSPAPTTSKEPQSYVQASVLVEPKSKEKDKDKDKKDEEEDQPDFSSPILNNGEKEKKSGPDPDRNFESEPKGGGTDGKDKDEKEMLNGGLDRLPRSYATDKNYDDEESEEDTCIVNCIYYTMECCKCSIV